MTFDEYREGWFDAFKAAGHTPVTDEDGDVDTFVTDSGLHNGPGCKTCGWSDCMHCRSASNIPACTGEKK